MLSTGLAPSGAPAGLGDLGPRQLRGSRWWHVEVKVIPAVCPDGLESVLALVAARSLFGGTAEACLEWSPDIQNLQDNETSVILLPRFYLRRKQ